MAVYNPDDWFVDAFGFEEVRNPNSEKAIYDVNVQLVKDHYKNGQISGINVGFFQLLNNEQIVKQVPPMGSTGKVTLSPIIADIVDLHRDPRNANATFQVASQLNCLEMAQPDKTPRMGVTMYRWDNTQGPLCAMTTPAGLLFRNYLAYVPLLGAVGQGGAYQIDCSYEARKFLNAVMGLDAGTYKNGYLFYNNDELNIVNETLGQSDVMGREIRKKFRSLINVGSHTNLGVCYRGQRYKHTVNHVYCSGLPISYAQETDPILWMGLSELFLEAMYEYTLMIAVRNNMENRENKPCFLTQIGGGAFGMNQHQIYRAIKRACTIVARNGHNLDVKFVFYKPEHDLIRSYGMSNKIHTGATSDLWFLSIWDKKDMSIDWRTHWMGYKEQIKLGQKGGGRRGSVQKGGQQMCRAITKSGDRCRNHAKHGIYCGIHAKYNTIDENGRV